MLTVIVSAFVAAAQSSPPAPPPSAPPTQAAKPKKICHKDASTGSILPKMVCRTQQEWDAIQQANINAFKREQYSTNPGGPRN